MQGHAVYILASRPRGALYVGMTSNLPKRVWEHRNGVVEGFTGKYNIRRLVYFEVFEDPHDAFTRERQIKEWRRAWKIELIEGNNPEWIDLWEKLEIQL